MTKKEFRSVVVFTFAMLLILVAACSFAKAADGLHILNHRRASMGLRPYLPAPELQAAAERSAQTQASRGRMSHQNHRGVRSGVGYDSRGPGYFKTCYSFDRIQPGTRAAAAYARGRNGYYFALDISGRRGGSTYAGGTMAVQYPLCPRCGKRHP